MELLGTVGLDDARITDRFDSFRETTKERTARKFGVVGVNIYAKKP